MRKYGHVYPACKEGAQGVLFTFSFTDRASWEDLPALIQRTRLPQDSLTPVGARYPSPTNYLPVLIVPAKLLFVDVQQS
ncbi:MAG: hypothetical protein ACK56I_12990, partial [bacterium]